MLKIILAIATTLALVTPIFSEAASLTGYAQYSGAKAYSVISNDLKYSDGTNYSDLPVLMICIDHSTKPPFNMQTSFLSEAGTSAIKGGSGDAGIAAIHWMVDHYFDLYYKNGTGPQQKAFQFAMWEIGNDYKGTASSINATAGTVRVSSESEYDGDQEFINTYQILYQAMATNLPALPTTYRSITYTLDLFKNQDPLYQNMVAIIERAPPNVVPIAAPLITGTPKVGSPVTGTYIYTDNNLDPENPGGTTYQFVTSQNSSIPNSTAGTTVASGVTGGASNSISYTPQTTEMNQYLYYRVTPAASTGASPGLEVCTPASGPVTAAPVNIVPTVNPIISGVPQVGSIVNGNYSYADTEGDIEAPAQTSYKFVTSANSTISSSSDGTFVAGGLTGGADNSASYTLQPSDLNKYIYFCVTPAAQTGASPGVEVCSAASGPVTEKPTPPAAAKVPSLGAWGLISLSSLLVVFGLVQSRRRQR